MTSQVATRTDQKLAYARLMIQELAGYAQAGSNDDWENAHQEAVFYHLAGSVEGVLHEINVGYGLALELDEVDWRRIGEALESRKLSSRAYEFANSRRRDTRSWLSQLYEWRNHGAHRDHVGKIINLTVGVRGADNEFKDPRTGAAQVVYPDQDCQDVLNSLARDVEVLIAECRRRDNLLP